MCTSPHRVFKTGLHTDTGKDLLYFDCHYPHPPLVSKALAEKVLHVSIPYDPRYMRLVGETVFLDTYVDVPCGKCDECTLSNAKKWAQRCLMEMSNTDGPCWFLTLTFNDFYCPQKVCKKDVSMFMKRLRSATGKEGMRFFACGEYGEKGGRPHYHIILFDCPLDDLYLVDASRNLRGSKTIDRIWPYGMHVLADVTLESVNYVARYTSKKSADKKGFVHMSRNPGIGHRYLVSHVGMFECDYLPLNNGGSLIRAPLPRYFEKLFPDLPWNELKAKRLDRAWYQRNLLAECYGVSGERLDDYLRVVSGSKAQRLQKHEI